MSERGRVYKKGVSGYREMKNETHYSRTRTEGSKSERIRRRVRHPIWSIAVLLVQPPRRIKFLGVVAPESRVPLCQEGKVDYGGVWRHIHRQGSFWIIRGRFTIRWVRERKSAWLGSGFADVERHRREET